MVRIRCASDWAVVGKKPKVNLEDSCRLIAIFQERGDVGLRGGGSREE